MYVRHVGANLELNVKHGIKTTEFIQFFNKIWRVRREKPQGQNLGIVNLQETPWIPGKRLRKKG